MLIQYIDHAHRRASPAHPAVPDPHDPGRSGELAGEQPPLGPSLGYTRWQNIWHVLPPASSTAILSGITLSIGRAAEDTAAIMLTGRANAGIPGHCPISSRPCHSAFYLTAEHRDELELLRHRRAGAWPTATLFSSPTVSREDSSADGRWESEHAGAGHICDKPERRFFGRTILTA